MAGLHTDAVLNKLSKRELVQLVLNTDAKMGFHISSIANEIKYLLAYFKRLEEEVTILQKANEKLVERLADNERLCWGNA